MAWRLIRQKSTNQWLQVVLGATTWDALQATPAAKHLQQIADAWSLPVADLESWEGSDRTPEEMNQAIGAGTVPTLPPEYPVCRSVRLAPKSTAPNVANFRGGLIGALTGPTAAAKFGRAKEIRQKWPGFAEPFLGALRDDELSNDDAAWLQATWKDAVARVGSGTDEIITATERDAILVLAKATNIPLA